MKLAAKSLLLLSCFAVMAHAQTFSVNTFKHVVVIFQENRTPDNLFHGLTPKCTMNASNCTTQLTTTCYDIATCGLSNQSGTDVPITLTSVQLANTYDLSHAHTAFVQMCDLGPNGCQNDGAWQIECTPNKNTTCPVNSPPTNPQYRFVDNSSGTVQPYLDMAMQYGWGNAMFQTNQGPSLPAHQFIFGATSAPTAQDDANGTFISENPGAPMNANYKPNQDTGCLAPLNEFSTVISPNTGSCPSGCTCFNSNTVKECKLVNDPLGTLCFQHATVPTLLSPQVTSWKYYGPQVTTNPNGSNPEGSIWMAPASIIDICQPDPTFTTCTGPAFTGANPNVDLNPADVLKDIGNCNLANISWVIPKGQNSDHAGTNTGGGPSWVASIVNTIGSNTTCDTTNGNTGYWFDTAIIITWDDWGGWTDHVPPQILSGSQGTYQYGFRVPLVVISAYTPKGYINNNQHDFGSVVRFIESVFNIEEGALNFADARATNDLHAFFSLTTPRGFTMINAPISATFFLNDTTPATFPDDD